MKSRLKRGIKKIYSAAFGKRGKYKCSICNSYINAYLPLPESYKEESKKLGYEHFGKNEHLNVEQYQCSNCLASDRDRFFAAYFKEVLKIPENSEKTLLHVAPSWGLNNRFLKKYFSVTTTDLMMEDVDVKSDVEDMKVFDNDSFDFLICSHVLEHVTNPDTALKELLRVLKKGGKAILMVPVNPEIAETLEDPSHTTREERIKHYGQEDHLRLFAKQDFMNRIVGAGFKLEMLGKRDFGKTTYTRLGLRESSILYIGSK